MRKVPQKYVEAFTRGLRATAEPRNQDRLARSYNAKPLSRGLAGWEEIPQIVGQDVVDFPFPQLLLGSEICLIANETVLQLYNPATGNASALATFDYTDGTTPKDIIAGGLWHWVDLGKLFMLTNGVCIVFRDNSGFDYANPSVVKVANDVVIGTMCEWRGRVFSAGFRPTLFWKDAWKTALEGFRDDSRVPDFLRDMSYQLDEQFVLWSTIGTSDLSFRWLLYPEESTGGFGVDVEGASWDAYPNGRTPLQEAILRNEFGMMRMPLQGKIHRILPHARGVVVYGSDGIVLLEHRMTDFSTFGMEVISKEVGVAGRGAVFGDEKQHCFVDTEGTLCLLNAKGEVTVLGFQEFFKPMLSSDIVVSYNGDLYEPEFYISSPEKAFCLTTRGLGEMFQSITSVAKLGGTTACVSRNRGDLAAHIETSDYNGGLTGLKQLCQARLVSNRDDLVGATKLSFANGRPSIETRSRRFNPEGNLWFGDSGNDIRVLLDCTDPAGLLIERLDLEVAYIDKTSVGTIYAQETGQSTD